MKLEILNVKHRGDLDAERIIIEAHEDCDIGRFILSTAEQRKGGKVSNKISQPYWFPDQEVKKGDWIIVFTKDGVNSVKENSSGNKSYFYYRSLDKPILADNKTSVLLFALETWKIFSKIDWDEPTLPKTT
jgi:hypothetical protein